MTFLEYLASAWTDVNAKRSAHGDSVRALDGLRGVAVINVLASHTGAFGMAGQGALGVFLFFTLSGFVLMLPFADRPDGLFQSAVLVRYFANRLLRILPAFAAVVLILKWQIPFGWDWAWQNLSFAAGWNHLWSVTEEVRFYLLFPFVVAALAVLPSRLWRAAALIDLILLAWFLQRVHLINMMDGLTVPFYFYFFLTGVLACLIYRTIAASWWLGIVALAILVAIFVLPVNGWKYSELWGLLFCILLVGVAASEGSLASRLLRSWIARHIGLLSYGLYLFHVPAQTIATRRERPVRGHAGRNLYCRSGFLPRGRKAFSDVETEKRRAKEPRRGAPG